MTRKKKSKDHKSPLIRLVGLEAAVAVTGIAGSLAATAAPGDLDPSFGDVGRQWGIKDPPYYSSLWSVDVQDDESVLFGGGGEYDYYGSYEAYFVGLLLPDGTPDASFAAAALEHAAVYDTTLQSDGKVIGVGVAKQPDGNRKLLVFRLRPDGALDPGFGLGGLVVVSDGSPSREAAYSVVVDPDGRIVVAGERNTSLLVARLLANGTLDAGFGSGGIYLDANTYYPNPRIAPAPGGGYRITANLLGGMGADCGVVGLTATGVLDVAFGIGGYADPKSPSAGSLVCSSLVVQPDGRVLVGGVEDSTDGYVGRLLPNGAADPAFDATVVPSQFKAVTALAIGATGSIFVAGSDRAGFSGALVVRLLADGTLDALFGRAGAATVDLKTTRASFPAIRDMKVVAGEGLVVGGMQESWRGGDRGPFVARLLGNAGGGSPGVLSMKQERYLGTEQGGQAVLSVRRTGGSEGAVAVTYTSRDLDPGHSPGEPATRGVDYTATTGRLTWADGDIGDREIVVPLVSDTNAEKPEFFEVVLESPEGGVGLGAFGADVEIAGASYPAGDFTIQASTPYVSEGDRASFRVSRNTYAQGAASVTVRVAAGGSATPGQDFRNPGGQDWQDIVLTWADGERDGKSVDVQIVADGSSEPTESFTLELVSPTGGAMLGDATQALVSILSSPSQSNRPPSSSGSGGGGAFGWLGAMLLWLAGAARRRLIRNR